MSDDASMLVQLTLRLHRKQGRGTTTQRSLTMSEWDSLRGGTAIDLLRTLGDDVGAPISSTTGALALVGTES